MFLKEIHLFRNKPYGDGSHAKNIHQNRTSRLDRDVKVTSYLFQAGMVIIEHDFIHFCDASSVEQVEGRPERDMSSMISRPFLNALYYL